MAIHSPILFFAQDREVADTAEPGDIIGIPNHGTLRVGDTLSEKNVIRFTGLPNFAPEILRRVALVDPTKTKQLRKALDDLSEEGVIQVFYPELGGQWIIGVVGQLQLEPNSKPRLLPLHAGSGGMRRRWRNSRNSTCRRWPRIATAIWYSRPRARGM